MTVSIPGKAAILLARKVKRKSAVTTMPATLFFGLAGLICLLTDAVAINMALVHAGDPEQISIRTLLSQAPSYHLHMVTLQGITRDLHILPPVPKFSDDGGCVLYGMATFTLDDETGSLPVELSGSCSPQAVITLPRDGEVVRLTAIIHLLTTDPPFRARAHATTIEALDLK